VRFTAAEKVLILYAAQIARKLNFAHSHDRVADLQQKSTGKETKGYGAP